MGNPFRRLVPLSSSPFPTLPLFFSVPPQIQLGVWESIVRSPSGSGRCLADRQFLVHSDAETEQFSTCVLVLLCMSYFINFTTICDELLVCLTVACGGGIMASPPQVIGPMESAPALAGLSQFRTFNAVTALGPYAHHHCRGFDNQRAGGHSPSR